MLKREFVSSKIMCGSGLTKTKEVAIRRLKHALGENLFAIILSGNVSPKRYKKGWGDLDLLLVLEKVDFDIKRQVGKIVQMLEQQSDIHHGINIISKKDFFEPVAPNISLEGKTLQALFALKRHPENLVYAKNTLVLEEAYTPDMETVKSYSLHNIGMFLRRNRRELATKGEMPFAEFKAMLGREIRSCFTITKLAVQYFTTTLQENRAEILAQGEIIFPEFDFSPIKSIARVVDTWEEIRTEEEILEIFKIVDAYIESFSRHVLQKATKQRKP
jgi:hypothetical protein